MHVGDASVFTPLDVPSSARGTSDRTARTTRGMTGLASTRATVRFFGDPFRQPLDSVLSLAPAARSELVLRSTPTVEFGGRIAGRVLVNICRRTSPSTVLSVTLPFVEIRTPPGGFTRWVDARIRRL